MTSSTNIQITHDLTVDDWFFINKVFYKISNKRKLHLIIHLAIILAAVYYTYNFIDYYFSYKTLRNYILFDKEPLVLCIITITGVILINPLRILIQRMYTKKFFKNPANSIFLEERNYDIDYDFINISNKNSNSKIPWQSVIKVVFTKKFYFIFINEIQAVIIKTDKTDKKSLHNLKNLILGKVNKNVIKTLKI